MKYDETDVHLHYNEARKLPKETITLWLSTISKYVPSNSIDIIIDIGCGTGRFSEALINYFSGKLYGIDPSVKMLNKAKEKLTSTTVEFLQGSAEYIPIADDSADLLFLSQVYHHIQDKNRAFSEFKRILKKKGILCIRNSTTENLDTILYLRFFPQALKMDYDYLPSRKEVINSLCNNGFKVRGHEIVRQKFAHNLMEYFNKVKSRALSDLVNISDCDFSNGLSKLERYCKENGTETDLFEDMDLFTFHL